MFLLFKKIGLTFPVNRLQGRRFTRNAKLYFHCKIMNKISSAAVVIGALRDNCQQLNHRKKAKVS